MSARTKIYHVIGGPYDGAVRNALYFSTADFIDYENIVLDLGTLDDGDSEARERRTQSIQQLKRVDSYGFPDPSCRTDLSDGAFAFIGYDIPETVLNSRLHMGSAKRFIWNFGSIPTGESDISCLNSDSCPIVYPFLDLAQESIRAGISTKKTVGVFFDPVYPGFRYSLIRDLLETLPEGTRLVYTEPKFSYADDPIVHETEEYISSGSFQAEAVRVPFDENVSKVLSLCSVVVSDYSCSKQDRYGFACALALAEGKILICDDVWSYAKYTEDRVNAIHVQDPKDFSKYVRWALENESTDPVRKLRAAAQYASCSHDLDPNMYRFRAEFSRKVFG